MPPRPKPRMTHFLAIPLATARSTPVLTEALQRLQNVLTALAGERISSPNVALDAGVSSSSRPAYSLTVAHRTSPDNPPPERDVPQNVRDAAQVALQPGCLRPATTLHLTLGTMALTTPERIDEAVQVLANLDLLKLLQNVEGSSTAQDRQSGPTAPLPAPAPTLLESECSEKLDRHERGIAEVHGQTSPLAKEPEMLAQRQLTANAKSEPKSRDCQPLEVSLRGLRTFSPRRATVLFAEVNEVTGRLQHVCEAIRAYFHKHHLLIDESRELTLHATIVNTIYGRRPQSQKSKEAVSFGRHRSKPSPRISLQPLLAYLPQEAWATIQLENLAICETGARSNPVDQQVRYVTVAQKPFP